jgi:inner membrane protein involved in colicin E2 resistance
MLLAVRRRALRQGAVTGGVVLIGMAFTALFVASLADAVDVPRHHLMFYVLFDMLLVLLVHLGVGAWLARNAGART